VVAPASPGMFTSVSHTSSSAAASGPTYNVFSAHAAILTRHACDADEYTVLGVSAAALGRPLKFSAQDQYGH
jgi:hypothetical protein